MEDIRNRMTPEGRERYENYKRFFGEEPEISTCIDAAYYGLITEEECVKRIKDTKRRKKCADIVIGLVCLPFFVFWFFLTIRWVQLVGMNQWYFVVKGPIAGAVGIIFSVLALWRGLKK